MPRFRTSLLLLAAFAVLLLAGTPAPTLMIFPPPDYIQCTCSFCKTHPDVDCQISPSGYSIMCSDWYATHC